VGIEESIELPPAASGTFVVPIIFFYFDIANAVVGTD